MVFEINVWRTDVTHYRTFMLKFRSKNVCYIILHFITYLVYSKTKNKNTNPSPFSPPTRYLIYFPHYWQCQCCTLLNDVEVTRGKEALLDMWEVKNQLHITLPPLFNANASCFGSLFSSSSLESVSESLSSNDKKPIK